MNKILQDDNLTRLKNLTKLVLVGGCFDVLHPAHIEFLKKSKQKGKNLVVLLESDKNIEKLKGKGRPINTQIVRSQKLSNISDVDYIILLKTPQSSQYYYNLVKLIQPDIIAITEADPLTQIKEEQAEMVGGRVVAVMHRNTAHSTTNLLEGRK